MRPEEADVDVHSHTALLNRVYDAFNRRNPDLLDALLAPDVVDHTAGSGQRPGLQGIKEVWAQFWSRFPDIQVTPEDVIAEGNRVGVRLSLRYTGPDGQRRSGRGFEFFTVAGGRIVELWNLLRLN